MEINGRKILATFRFGSSIYGLENEKSDKDYRALICPNWDELYLSARRQNPIKIGDFAEIDGVDYSVFNVMGLSTQMAIGSPYWLEILYSTEVDVCEDMKELWEFMVTNREDLVNMQRQAFFLNHVKAMKKHMKIYEKKGTPALLHHSLRHFYTIKRFSELNDYGHAIHYADKKSVEYSILMKLKSEISKGELDLIHEYVKECINSVGKYHEFYNTEYTGKHHAYIKEEISKLVRKTISV